MTAPTATYDRYDSTLDGELVLHARFAPLAAPAPLMLQMHGWHGNVKSGHSDNVAPPADECFFRVQPEMRGRGDSDGWPDANGLELQDAVDALAGARRLYPTAVADATPRLHGGSGGGGNVLGIVGKFPDLFASAVCECGISDYALWYANDGVGEFRDELRDAGWIGGDPHTNAEAYLSRGGRTTAMNLLTPLLIVHGEADNRVPFEQAEAYAAANARHGRDALLHVEGFPGVGLRDHYKGMTPEMTALRGRLIAAHHRDHSTVPTLPEQGEFVVAGYLQTRRFRIALERVDHVALLQYDLARNAFRLRGPSSRTAVVTTSDGRQLIDCERLSLADLCAAIDVPDPRDYTL